MLVDQEDLVCGIVEVPCNAQSGEARANDNDPLPVAGDDCHKSPYLYCRREDKVTPQQQYDALYFHKISCRRKWPA
jgi:hypothetical protein